MNIVMRGIFAATLAALAGAAAFAEPTVGELAPNYTIRMFDGSKRGPDDFRGKVVVINYWATWCGPCKSEMPMMSGFHRRHRDEGFEIVGVLTKDSAPKYQLKKVEALLSYSLASELKGAMGIIDGAVPSTYVIDREGRLRYRKAGSLSAKEFSDVVLPLLAKPA